jgi:hypothetical protein
VTPSHAFCRAELIPEESGAAGRSQTPDQLGRSQPLCSLSYDGKKMVTRGSFELPISGVKTPRPSPLDERAMKRKMVIGRGVEPRTYWM